MISTFSRFIRFPMFYTTFPQSACVANSTMFPHCCLYLLRNWPPHSSSNISYNTFIFQHLASQSSRNDTPLSIPP